MGFASSVRNNAVPEWRDFYIDYDRLRSKLKKKSFQPLLYAELTKINNFFFLLERKAVDEKNKIFDDVFTEMPHENFDDLRAQTEDTDGETSSGNDVARAESYEEPGFSVRKNSNGDFQGNRGEVRTDDEEDIPDTESGSTESETRQEEEEEGTPSESSAALTETLKEHIGRGLKRFMRLPGGITRRRKEKVITEFLHTLVKITTYRDLNSSAMLKLAEKHSKKFSGFYEEFEKKYHETYLFKSKKIEQIRTAMKQLYKRLFASNQPDKAKRVFKRIKKGLVSSDWLFIISGFLTGLSLAVSFCIFPFDAPSGKNLTFWAVNNIYMGFLAFGLCIKVFKSVHINYKFIFNFDVCSSMNNSLYLLTISLMFAFNLVAYGLSLKIDRNVYLFLIILQACVLFIPLDILFYNSRLYLIGVFARAVLQPLSTIRFRHFYFADVAQSFSFPIKQIASSFGVRRKIILTFLCAVFPTVRILQCLKRYKDSRMFFPHIVNCFKFSLGLLFAFSPFIFADSPHYTLVFSVIGLLSTLASITWDLFMDWGILRTRRLFPFYAYSAIIGYNVAARFLWAIKLMTKIDEPVLESLAEILRRFLWTLLRVEVEHLNNCDEFKIKNAISLTAGELFYKKDQVEIYRERQYGYETETETEAEEQSERRSLSSAEGL